MEHPNANLIYVSPPSDIWCPFSPFTDLSRIFTEDEKTPVSEEVISILLQSDLSVSIGGRSRLGEKG